MSTRFDLPSGAWVELKDVHELKARDRKAILRGMPKDDEDHPYSLYVDVSDSLAQVAVVAWSLGDVLPQADVEVLGDLEIADSEKLSELLKPLSAALFPAPAVPEVTPEGEIVADPTSPTPPESA